MVRCLSLRAQAQARPVCSLNVYDGFSQNQVELPGSALTFPTNKAANEMIHRLDGIPDIRQRAFVGTLHSFCMEVLANRGKTVGIAGLPHIFDSSEDRKQILLKYRGEGSSTYQPASRIRRREAATNALARWLGMISEAKNALRLCGPRRKLPKSA